MRTVTESDPTVYQTMERSSDPEGESFRKHCAKRRKCCKDLTAFSPFPTMHIYATIKPNLICTNSDI